MSISGSFLGKLTTALSRRPLVTWGKSDVVVALGGDGMVGAVASAVAQARPDGDGVFGVIPAGRGNDLVRTHGIPFGPTDAAQLLLAGQSRPMDLIAITGADGTRATVAGSVYLGIATWPGKSPMTLG